MKQLFFRKPADDHGTGLFIGGAFFPYAHGIVAIPSEGNYAAALPRGFVQVEGTQVPGAGEPRPVSELSAEELQAIEPGSDGGDPGRPGKRKKPGTSGSVDRVDPEVGLDHADRP